MPPAVEFPDVDGLVGVPLHQIVVDDPSPGPAARIEAVRRHLERPRRWRLPGELVLQDGFPCIVGIGARLRAEHPWAVEGDRPELRDDVHQSMLSGTCMNPVFWHEAVVVPYRLPRVGEAAAVWWRQSELGDFIKWTFAPIPPRNRWGAFPDAVLLWGAEDFPRAVVASPLAAIARIDTALPAQALDRFVGLQMGESFAPTLAALAV